MLIPRIYHCMTLAQGIGIALVFGLIFFGLIMFLNIQGHRRLRAERERQDALRREVRVHDEYDQERGDIT